MKLTTNELVICSIVASLTAILTQISIPIPPIPITMQIFAISLCGIVLGKRLGFISISIYVLLGAIGMPVFSHFNGGIGYILGPTGGFILSFPIMVYIVGYFSDKYKSTIGVYIGMIIGLLVSYTIGTIYFCIITNTSFIKGITLCVLPFIIADIFKITLASVVRNKISKRINLRYTLKKNYYL